MRDWIIGGLSMAALCAFVGILIVYVARPDLSIIIVVVLLVGCYDFWQSLRSKNGNSNEY